MNHSPRLRSGLMTCLVSLFLLTNILAQQAQPLNTAALDEKSYGEIDTMIITYHQQGDFANAIPLVKYVRARAKAEFGPTDSLYTLFTDNLAVFYSKSGNYKKAKELFEEAVELWAKVVGKQHPDYVIGLTSLGGAYLHLGNYTKAEQILLQALAIWGDIENGIDTISYAVTLLDLGSLYSDQGRYQEAIRYVQKSIKLLEQANHKQTPFYLGACENLAVDYQRLGKYKKAEKLYNEVLHGTVRLVGKEHPAYARILINLGALYLSNKQYELAESFYLQALPIEKKTTGELHPEYATTLNNLGAIYEELGKNKKAKQCYLQSLEIRKTIFGKEHVAYLTSLSNLGLFYVNTKDYPKAKECLTIAEDIGRRTLGTKHDLYLTVLSNMALLYSYQDNNEQAVSTYKKILPIFEELFGQQHKSYIGGLNNLASIALSEKEYAVAEEYLWQAIEANVNQKLKHGVDESLVQKLQTIPLTSIYSLTNSLKLLHRILGVRGDKAEQRLVTQLVLALLAKNRHQLSEEGDKLRVLKQNHQWTLAYLNTLDPQEDALQALETAEQDKSVLLLDATQTQHAYHFGNLPDSLVNKEQQLLAQKQKLKGQLLKEQRGPQKKDLRTQLNQTNQAINELTDYIRKNYPNYAQLKYQANAIDIQSLQASLGEQQAMIEYLVGDSTVHLFFVDKQTVKWLSVPLRKQVLAKKIQQMHDVLSNYQNLVQNADRVYQDYIDVAYWCYQKLIAPFQKELSSKKELLIVTDGELGHLPFGAFLTKKATAQKADYQSLAYLINNYSISYNYSATLWQTIRQKDKMSNNGQLLAMAADYRSSNSVGSRLPSYQKLRKALSPLPAAEKEVQIIQNAYGGSLFTNKQANERTFKNKASEYGMIHLAMHGILNQNTPMLSSIAFTEDGDSLEDNFLHAYEISKLDLHADLVVLSACETGYGKFETGNGIASIARAFVYAGVPSLVVSLWQVNDQATAEIMQLFYQNMHNGMTQAEALRQAKLSYIKTAQGVAAHPAFWSPFVQLGNSRPIQLTAQKSPWLWWLGGGVLIVVGIGAWGLGRRKKTVA